MENCFLRGRRKRRVTPDWPAEWANISILFANSLSAGSGNVRGVQRESVALFSLASLLISACVVGMAACRQTGQGKQYTACLPLKRNNSSCLCYDDWEYYDSLLSFHAIRMFGASKIYYHRATSYRVGTDHHQKSKTLTKEGHHYMRTYCHLFVQFLPHNKRKNTVVPIVPNTECL